MVVSTGRNFLLGMGNVQGPPCRSYRFRFQEFLGREERVGGKHPQVSTSAFLEAVVPPSSMTYTSTTLGGSFIDTEFLLLLYSSTHTDGGTEQSWRRQSTERIPSATTESTGLPFVHMTRVHCGVVYTNHTGPD